MLDAQLQRLLADCQIRSKEDLDRFALEHAALAEQMRESLARAMLRSRSSQLRMKPAEHVGKCLHLLMDVDPRLFARMDPEEKQTLKASLDELSRLVAEYQERLKQ